MAGTNFNLAPPAKLVDGLLAVPIDIQRITASLTFDGASQSGSGDAALVFTMGSQDGNPIFDLRQTITAAWLDGTSLPVTKLGQHDFGGGAQAELRVVEAVGRWLKPYPAPIYPGRICAALCRGGLATTNVVLSWLKN